MKDFANMSRMDQSHSVLCEGCVRRREEGEGWEEKMPKLCQYRGCYGGRRGEKNNFANKQSLLQEEKTEKVLGRKIQYVQNGSKPQRVGWQIGNFPIICAGTNFRKTEQNSQNSRSVVSTTINSLATSRFLNILCSSLLIEYILLYLISFS